MASSRLKKNVALVAALATLVGGFEGLRTYAYRDPVGIPTICFGETRGVKIGDKATAEQCRAMLGLRLVEFASGVDKCLTKQNAVTDGAYMAFVSLAYNIGVGAFCKSPVVTLANAGRLTAACNAMTAFVYARGIKLPGLVARREAERKVCLG